MYGCYFVTLTTELILSLHAQRVSSSFPCPIYESSTNCTLFAATDASWEALASFVGMSVHRFEQSPIIKPVRPALPCRCRCVHVQLLMPSMPYAQCL